MTTDTQNLIDQLAATIEDLESRAASAITQAELDAAVQVALAEQANSYQTSIDDAKAPLLAEIESLKVQRDDANARAAEAISPAQYAEVVAARDEWKAKFDELNARIDAAQAGN